MALSDKTKAFLDGLGFDPDAVYDVPESAWEASLQSLESFIGSSVDAKSHACESSGTIHITGPAVLGHTAPAKAVGELLSSFQGAVDAVGASMSGRASGFGPIPKELSARTKMSLIASPLPGSVVIRVAPTMKRMDDLEPEGPSLFDPADIGLRPLADEAMERFTSLLSVFDETSPESGELIERLTEMGPRVATNIKAFYDSIGRGSMDVDLSWLEPGADRRRSYISHSEARLAVKAIDEAKIESTVIHVIGELQTATVSNKDKLRVKTADGIEKTISLGLISTAEIMEFRTGQGVDVEVECRTSVKPGGKHSEKLSGVSISILPTLP